MPLSEKEVRAVAHLARLRVNDDEVVTFTDQLSAILNYIEKLGELDTTDVVPTSHALDLTNAFRDDKVEERFRPGIWRDNAPQPEQGHFRVPKVIE